MLHTYIDNKLEKIIPTSWYVCHRILKAPWFDEIINIAKLTKAGPLVVVLLLLETGENPVVFRRWKNGDHKKCCAYNRIHLYYIIDWHTFYRLISKQPEKKHKLRLVFIFSNKADYKADYFDNCKISQHYSFWTTHFY